MEIKGTTGAQALLRLLSGMGVDRIFASPGSEYITGQEIVIDGGWGIGVAD